MAEERVKAENKNKRWKKEKENSNGKLEAEPGTVRLESVVEDREKAVWRDIKQ